MNQTKITFKMGVSVRYSPYELVIDQKLGENIVSKKSDVWMYGCILFVVFFEAQPWQGKNQNQMYDLIKSRRDLIENSDFDLNTVPPIPPQILDLLREIFNHDFNQRPDMNEILEVLEDLMKNYAE